MFDFDAGKLLIIGIVALIFIPSKDLPRVLRQMGQFVGKMRRMAGEFQTQFMDAMREADLAELRREAEKLTKAAEINPDFSVSHSSVSHSEPAPSLAPADTQATPPEHHIAPPGTSEMQAAQHEPQASQQHEPQAAQREPQASLEAVDDAAHPSLPPPVHDGA